MARLALTLACGDYDRTRALADGRVTVEGADLTVFALGPEEIFFRMVRFEEFDVAELSLSTYVLTAQRDAPFVAIPVFTSREFRHNGIYVHPGAGVDSPQDLVGRRVGVAEYQLTANVWIRGILADLLRAGLAVLRRQGRAGPALTAYLRRQRSGRTTPAPTLRPHIRGAAALAA